MNAQQMRVFIEDLSQLMHKHKVSIDIDGDLDLVKRIPHGGNIMRKVIEAVNRQVEK